MFSLLKSMFRRGEVDCDEVRRRSSDYLEEDLPAPKLSAIRAHLGNCGPCRSFVGTLASTIGVLRRFPKVSPPSSFKETVMERIKREE